MKAKLTSLHMRGRFGRTRPTPRPVWPRDLNGGLFLPHEIERAHRKIEVPARAFTAIFAFFDEYDWFLDDRELKDGKEINPDVLGYIFEKYINQKQMGAYYTKEDITGYIARNTILPFWLEQMRAEVPAAFEGENAVWELLRQNPDRYIYPAVRFGLTDENGVRALPEPIARGVEDVAQRDAWNRPAPADWGLPTEIWRETVARRAKYLDVRARCEGKNGSIESVDDLVTLNLNIEQFAADVVSMWADETLLRAAWKILAGGQNRARLSGDDASNGISVLDPTCGSGAFLFAAINILEPLYTDCLERMEKFVADADARGVAKCADFREILARALDKEQHPNREYFVLKSIAVNNLFGVDIMPEAVEICKLRLFLKLASCVEPQPHKKNFGIEPLPDIDFNIREGNTLVGYASVAELRTSSNLLLREEAETIETEAAAIGRDARDFRETQLQTGAGSAVAKAKLEGRMMELQARLNEFLAEDYEHGISAKPKAMEAWKRSHQPFHWFIEFHGILDNGGFDVVIGNPPYVEYAKVKNSYTIKNYETERCGNLHAYVVENAISHLTSFRGRVGFIVPLPSMNTERMSELQHLIKPNNSSNSRSLWIASFDERPGSLFSGVDQRLIVEVFGSVAGEGKLFTTGINRWASIARDTLFSSLNYAHQPEPIMLLTETILKVKNQSIEESLLPKLYSNRPIGEFKSQQPTKNLIAYRSAGGRYWKVVLDKPFGTTTASEKFAYFNNLTGKQAVAVISSSTFWWYYSCHFDMFNLADYMIFGFRFSKPSKEVLDSLEKIGGQLLKSLKDNSQTKIVASRTQGEVTQNNFVVSKSKPIIDEIDRVLASHYGFTGEELDFIINYDIKYRMGREELG